MEIDLVCFGNVTIDDTVQPDGTTKMRCFGGNTIYAALSASLWNNNIRVVTPIGNDFPQEHIERIKELGWDISGMPERDMPTTWQWIIYEYDMTRTWIPRSDPSNFYELSPKPEDIPASYLNSKAFLVLAMDLKSQEILAPYLKSQGGIVALDPQEDNVVGNQDRVYKILESVDIFLPSQAEVHRLQGHDDYRRAAREFSAYGPDIVGIKLGENGALIYKKDIDKFYEIPAFRTDVVDTTGAGDSFSGGFMAMYVKTRDIYKSGVAGAVSASYAIEDFGNERLFQISPEDTRSRFDALTPK